MRMSNDLALQLGQLTVMNAIHDGYLQRSQCFCSMPLLAHDLM